MERSKYYGVFFSERPGTVLPSGSTFAYLYRHAPDGKLRPNGWLC